ncbi:MAG: PAS domain S-box protein [Geobacteraceae bacterium]|nr:PAS domain S-box protein [Geobacteraceae bacterium]
MGNIDQPITEAGADEKLLHEVVDSDGGEKALRESEEKFSKVFHAAPAILAFTAMADGRFIEVNEAFERAFGYLAEEVIGRTSLELDIWADPADRAGMVKTLNEGGKVRDCEVNFRDKAGKILVGLYSAEIVEIKGEQYLLSLVNDVTERKRTEERLQESEERYRRIVETSREGILSLDREARITYVNRQMADMLGQRGGEMVGRPFLAFVDDSALCEVSAGMERRQKGVREQYETVLLRAGGEKIWVSISATPIMGGDGEFIGSFAMISDISERKQAAAEIEVLNTNLAARASELEIANEELEAFSSMVSHDLRKPLTAISGYSQLILELCGANLDRECRSYLQEVLNGTFRMNQLIDTLLNFSQRSRTELRREEVDLSEMAQTVISELRLTEPQRRVSWTIAEGVVVNGDAGLLRAVLDNLLGNAWKYTARNEEAVIEFGVSECRGQPACFVRDNGVGFDMAHKDRLFSPFQRLQNAGEFEGTGIGLATVQRIVQRHGGQVWAEGETGKGATFYFTLG